MLSLQRATTAHALLVAGVLACSAPARAQAQASATVHVVTRSAAGPIAGALVATRGARAQTDSLGDATLRIAVPPASATIVVRRIGFAPDSLPLALRPGLDTGVVIVLRAQAATIAPVIVTSTRTERRVEDEPLRIEVLAGDDVGEKTLMHPADLRVLLTEMSGVRVQTTSPSLGGAVVRIQGLRGHDTQVLTDGLPLYGAQAGAFGLLQIPPLDLRQAEVVKGAASALYGPNALGGVLNLISRRPSDSSEVLLNLAARGGGDLVAFGARERGGWGGTVLAGAHVQRQADVDADGYVDIPGVRRLEVRPRLMRADSTGGSLMLTAGAFAESRAGGITGPAAEAVPESLVTRHADIGATMRRRLAGGALVAGRFAANVQARTRRFGAAREREHAGTLFGEITATILSGTQTVLAGVAAQVEHYRNRDVPRFDETRSTPSLFVQHTLVPADWLSTQLNARCDASSAYGTYCTPRASVLWRAPAAVNVRLSAAGGWAAPTARSEDTEVFGLTPVSGPLAVHAERARTASLDVSTTRGPLELSGTLFASRILEPVGLRRTGADTGASLVFVNAAGPAIAHGGELFAVYNQEPLVVTAFYAATRTREVSAESGRVRESPYVPRETAALDVAFDEDESGTRVGLELFYTGPQALDDNPYRAIAPAFVTVGVLASRRIGAAMLYLNVENLGNVRQGAFDPVRRPAAFPGEGGRRAVDAWAPLDGRLVNAGLRLRL